MLSLLFSSHMLIMAREKSRESMRVPTRSSSWVIHITTLSTRSSSSQKNPSPVTHSSIRAT